jgi:DNA-binding protein HU-beta
VSKKDVQTLLSELSNLIERELGEEGPGEFVVPDLVKFKVKVVPARAAYTGPDPFTKEERAFPAKPASRKVRASPGSRLKKMGA